MAITPCLWFASKSASPQVMCATQDDIDHSWAKLGEGGDPKARRTLAAMLKLKKIDLTAMQRARDGV